MLRIILTILFCLPLCGLASAQDAGAGQVLGRGGIPVIVLPVVVPPITKPAVHPPVVVEIPTAATDQWQRFLVCVGEPTGTENHFEEEREALLKRAEKEGITPQLLQDAETYRQSIAGTRSK